jgi:membrane associated rhomboid family serine protease
MFSKNVENKYVSELLAFIIILVHVLQNLKITGGFPCSNTMISNIYSNFFHIDLIHLLINLHGLYTFSNLEKKIGTKKFCFLILFLLITTAFFETTLKTIFPSIKCSVGLSGIIFGMATFVKTIDGKYDNFIRMIAIQIVYDYSHRNSISITSHIIGIICGIIAGFLFSKFNFWLNNL